MSGISPPTPYQWNVGDVGSAALLNAQLYTGLQFLLNPPLFEAIQATTKTTVTTGTSWTILPFTDVAGIITDTYTGWASGIPSRYTAQVPGWYWVSGCVCWSSNATGNRGIRITKNGTAVQGGGTIVGGAATSQDTAAPILRTRGKAVSALGSLVPVVALLFVVAAVLSVAVRGVLRRRVAPGAAGPVGRG